MTPLETIKEGILAGDITLVIEGYNRITGEKIAVPEPEPVQQRQPPRSFRQSPEYYGEEDDSFNRPPDRNRNNDNDSGDGKIAARAEPFVPKKRINMFFDEREALPDYTEADKAKDQAAKRKAKAQRPAPYKPVQINCDGCGNRYNVNPIFVIDGVYRCDRCTGKRR